MKKQRGMCRHFKIKCLVIQKASEASEILNPRYVENYSLFFFVSNDSSNPKENYSS